MCLNPGLKLLPSSRIRELSTTEDNVSLYFLRKEDVDFPGGPCLEHEEESRDAAY
jgi:hypothetical protein